MMRRRFIHSALTLSAAGALLLTGCAPGVSSSPPATGDSPQPVSTEISAATTLRVAGWDDSDLFPQIIAAFEKKYPNVKVDYEYTQASDYQKTIKLNMQSENPPDVAQYNTPMRDLNAAGLIADLDPYADAYGWNDLIAKSLLDQTRFTKDGKTMGEGNLIAAPYIVPVLGVFVNKSLETKAGLNPAPATLAEFEENLKKAKDAGLQPLSVGALDFGGIHNWAGLLNANCSPDLLKSWLFGHQGASIDDPCAVEASSTLQRWYDEGYYPVDANGTGDSDAAARMAAGKAVYMLTGGWYGGQFEEGLGGPGSVGFYLLPPKQAGGPATDNASVAAFSVSAKSKNKDAAAAFLNFLFSEEAGKIITATGQLSCNPAANTGLEGVRGDIATAFEKVVQSDAALIWPDQAAPTLLDLITADVQLLFGGKKTAQELVSDVQADWAEYHK